MVFGEGGSHGIVGKSFALEGPEFPHGRAPFSAKFMLSQGQERGMVVGLSATQALASVGAERLITCLGRSWSHSGLVASTSHSRLGVLPLLFCMSLSIRLPTLSYLFMRSVPVPLGPCPCLCLPIVLQWCTYHPPCSTPHSCALPFCS